MQSTPPEELAHKCFNAKNCAPFAYTYAKYASGRAHHVCSAIPFSRTSYDVCHIDNLKRRTSYVVRHIANLKSRSGYAVMIQASMYIVTIIPKTNNFFYGNITCLREDI